MAAGLAHLKELIDRVRIRDRAAAEVGHADGAVRPGANLEIVGGAAVGAKEIEDLIWPEQHVVSATRREFLWDLIWGRWSSLGVAACASASIGVAPSTHHTFSRVPAAAPSRCKSRASKPRN